MSIYIAQPLDEAQDKALKAVLDALKVPCEAQSAMDETEYLLSSEANKNRLLNAIANEGQANKTVTLDEI